MTERDPLAILLSDHIWYTTTTLGSRRSVVVCKCTARMDDSNQHADHVTRIARNFLAAA